MVPFDDLTGDPSLKGLGELVADWVAGELARSAVAQVVPAASVRAHWRLVTAGSGSALSILPQRFGAGTAVSGALRVADGRVRIEAEIIDARSGQLLQALVPLSAPRDSTGPLIAVTAQRVVAAVAIRLSPQFQWALPTGIPPTLDAFREFEAAMVLMGQVRLPEALTGLYKAHAIDSSYLAPLLPAAAAHIMLGQLQQAESLLVALGPHEDVLTAVDRAHRDWLFAWIHGDLDREYRAAEELFAAAPETFAYHLGLTSVRTNRPERALEAFPPADLESPWMKGFYLYWTFYGEANHMLGRVRGALDVLERGRRLHPDEPSLLRGEIQVRAALGQVHEVDSLLELVVTLPAGAGLSYALTSSDAALEFWAHGHRAPAEALLRQAVHRITSSPADEAETSAHKYELARILYWSGRWDDALPLFKELVQERPTSTGHLGFLGTTFGRLGRRGDALEIAERLRALEQPYFRGPNTLWRARIAAVLGDQAEAVRLLGQAIGEGQTYGAWIHRDPDLHLLISYPPFQELVRPKG